MTIGALLSIIFFALQYIGQIDWEWWQIVMPMLIEIGLYVLVWLLILIGGVWSVRR